MMTVCRPLACNINRPKGATLALCRYCGAECWRLAAEPEPLPTGYRPACTECALRRNSRQRDMDDALTVKVVSVHDYNNTPREELLEERDRVEHSGRWRFIYVGRANRFCHLPAHPLANPFRVPGQASQMQRFYVVEQYRAWLMALPDAREQLIKLHRLVNRTGFPLACWCGRWPEEEKLACHAVVLAHTLMTMDKEGVT